MREYIFDEKKSIEKMIEDRYVDATNPTNTIINTNSGNQFAISHSTIANTSLYILI